MFTMYGFRIHIFICLKTLVDEFFKCENGYSTLCGVVGRFELVMAMVEFVLIGYLWIYRPDCAQHEFVGKAEFRIPDFRRNTRLSRHFSRQIRNSVQFGMIDRVHKRTLLFPPLDQVASSHIIRTFIPSEMMPCAIFHPEKAEGLENIVPEEPDNGCMIEASQPASQYD